MGARASAQLGSFTWPDVDARAPRSILAVPLGSTEQHGPHLPLSTDTDIALGLAIRLAERVPEVLVAPAIPYGASGEHAGFAGTLSIGHEALELLLVELGRSSDAFDAVVIISAHGGNAAAVARAVALLRSEGRRVAAWSPRHADPRDTHAGRTETSVMMALGSPNLVYGRATVGNRRPIDELMPVLRRGGMAAVSESGVLGDPSGSSEAHGEDLLRAWTDELVAAVSDL